MKNIFGCPKLEILVVHGKESTQSNLSVKNKGRTTIKSLREEFKNEVNYLKDRVTFLEDKINISECKVQELEEKLTRKPEVHEKHVAEVQLVEQICSNCKTCGENCNSKTTLRKHIAEYHPIKMKCKSCTAHFPKVSDLEKHLEENMNREESTVVINVTKLF